MCSCKAHNLNFNCECFQLKPALLFEDLLHRWIQDVGLQKKHGEGYKSYSKNIGIKRESSKFRGIITRTLFLISTSRLSLRGHPIKLEWYLLGCCCLLYLLDIFIFLNFTIFYSYFISCILLSWDLYIRIFMNGSCVWSFFPFFL